MEIELKKIGEHFDRIVQDLHKRYVANPKEDSVAVYLGLAVATSVAREVMKKDPRVTPDGSSVDKTMKIIEAVSAEFSKKWMEKVWVDFEEEDKKSENTWGEYKK